MPPVLKHSADLAAGLHLLSAPRLEGRLEPFLDAEPIPWLALLAETERMSNGERLLVLAAYDLCHARTNVGLWEIARRLDEANYRRAVETLEISRRPRRGDTRKQSRRPDLRLLRGEASA